MSRWMDSVDKAMEKEFGDFYDSFLEKPADADKKEEGKAKEGEKKEGEQAKDETADGKPQYYSLSTSMYSGSDGVQHIYREETDSKTGKHKTVETRRIGNKSMTLHRVTDKDGHVEEHETKKNLKDDEVEAFKKDWESRQIPAASKLQAPEEKKAIKNWAQNIFHFILN